MHIAIAAPFIMMGEDVYQLSFATSSPHSLPNIRWLGGLKTIRNVSFLKIKMTYIVYIFHNMTYYIGRLDILDYLLKHCLPEFASFR